MCENLRFIICDNYHCIYEKDGKCLLDSIRLDDMGICNSGINASLEGDLLEEKKAELLKELDPDLL